MELFVRMEKLITKVLFPRTLVILVILLAVTTAQRTRKEFASEEPNPLIEMLQEQLQSQGGAGTAQVVSGLVQNLIQSYSGRQLGDLLAGAAKANTGGNIGGVLSELIASATSNQGNSNFDPQLIGQVVNMFTSTINSDDHGDGDVNNVDINNNEIKKVKNQKKSNENNNDAGIDWESVIGLATNFIATQNGAGKGWEGVLNMLPLLLGGEENNEGMKLNNKHHQHKKTSYLPSFMETLYDYWEHFKSSELGQTLWHNSGLESTAALFTDKDGHFEMGRIFESLENATFRRRWLKSLTTFVAEWIAHVSDPAIQTRYLTTVQFVVNGFLKSQGYHKTQLFDPNRPSESLSHLINAVFKRQFDLKVNSAVYIKPAVAYIQEVFKMGQSKGLSLSRLNSNEIKTKLSETLNGEIIEPMLRVWRAYRFGTMHPNCDSYVICAVNQQDPSVQQGAQLRPGVTKLASITASWFLSSNTGTPFWKLYNAATEDHNCKAKYPVDCSEYHTEDIRATTEYMHSEL